MLVWHGVWLPAPDAVAQGRLGIWAEDSSGPAVPPRRPGRPPRVRPHPFAADHETLRAHHNAADATSTAVLRLPTRAGGPVASPELIRESVDEARGSLQAADWEVPIVAYPVDPAYALLRTMDHPTEGGSLHHLSDVAAFAADLAGRGRVLPSIEPRGPYAIWLPLLTGPDAAWARVLASSMPPVLTAADPGRRLTVWAEVLNGLVDAAVRARLDGSRLNRVRGADAVSRAWLGALTGGDRGFTADPGAVVTLADALSAWQADAVAGAVRACFRLVEPDLDHAADDAGDDPLWELRFALQASDEPSLVVDADDVWRSRGPLAALAQHLDAPQETLLAELGKASRLYPALDDALRVARPQRLALDTGDAHAFLTSTAPALATAGFGVQLPGWWTRPSGRLSLRVSASTPAQPGQVATAGRVVGFDAIAEFGYQLAIGDQALTEDELAELAALKAPLVQFRGRWMELDARRLAAGLKLVGERRTTTIGDLLRLALGAGPTEADELPISDVEADGWLGELLSGQAEHRLRAVELPAGFTGQLRPYQARGLSWLDFLDRVGLGGVLADDMGLGKTVQLLALMATDDHEERLTPSLLICPMSLVGNWQREAARFTPQLRIHVHHGGERARGRAFAEAVAQADLVITTYALAARDATELGKITWQRVIVDEAQAIKNSATKQATAIRSLPAGTRIAVTGTPVENRLADLWSILEFANPGLLGSASGFRKRYAEPIERHGDDDAAERLRRFTTPFVLRRLKTDPSIISDLPEKLEMDVLCNLTAEQVALYQAVVDDMLAKIASSEGIERRGLVLATMTKLKQVCNHPAHFLRDGSPLPTRSGKLERLEEILEEVLAIGERALLFTQYAEFGAMLRGHLVGRFGREVLFLHGGVPKEGRDDMVARFQSEDRSAPPLFVLSLKAGGTGLNLTAANHVVHVDRWWNPAVEDQATDRAFRIGQRRSVQVRKFVCAGTVEEKIATMIVAKRGLAARIVGTGEHWLTELSTGELAELLRLERGAGVE